jgi:hypothetical protein
MAYLEKTFEFHPVSLIKLERKFIYFLDNIITPSNKIDQDILQLTDRKQDKQQRTSSDHVLKYLLI